MSGRVKVTLLERVSGGTTSTLTYIGYDENAFPSKVCYTNCVTNGPILMKKTQLICESMKFC